MCQAAGFLFCLAVGLTVGSRWSQHLFNVPTLFEYHAISPKIMVKATWLVYNFIFSHLNSSACLIRSLGEMKEEWSKLLFWTLRWLVVIAWQKRCISYIFSPLHHSPYTSPTSLLPSLIQRKALLSTMLTWAKEEGLTVESKKMHTKTHLCCGLLSCLVVFSEFLPCECSWNKITTIQGSPWHSTRRHCAGKRDGALGMNRVRSRGKKKNQTGLCA